MFSTILPRARPANCQGVSQRPPLSILLAESNRELRRLLAFVLRSDGHNVTDAADGSELLEAIASLIINGDVREFDLIISAQSMPGIPGLSVLAGLRSRGRQTPFILLTDDAAVQSHAALLDAIVLPAPLNVQSIRRAVRQAELAAQASVSAVG